MIYLDEIINAKLQNEIQISYFDDKGGISMSKIIIPERERYVYAPATSTENAVPNLVSQNGGKVKRVRLSKGKKLGNTRIMEILFKNMKPELLEKFFANNEPVKWFMDIETEMVKGYSVQDLISEEHNNAIAEIRTNCMSNTNDEVYLFGLKNLSEIDQERLSVAINNYFADKSNYSHGYLPIKRDFKVKYIYSDSERSMMKETLHYMRQAPFIAGWNFWKFDINYINKRCEQFLDIQEPMAVTSPKYNGKINRKQCVYTLSLADKYNKDVRTRVNLPLHKAVIDYMDIFAKWDTSLKIKSSMNLDTIANDVLGIKKVPYSGTLNQLYEDDYIGFLVYNAIDTILVQLIDEKCATFSTMVTLANIGRVNLHDSMFASDVLKNKSIEIASKMGRVYIKDKQTDTSTYTGGFVHEPEPGMFENIVIEDFTSMFPSLTAGFNMDVSALVGETKDHGKTWVDKYGKTHILDKEKFCYSASGLVFSKAEDSVNRRMIGMMFDGRVREKNKAKDIEVEQEFIKRHYKHLLEDIIG